MPTTATEPFPAAPDHEARAARDQKRAARSKNTYRTAPIEERTAVLEARWEETIPTLATKTDISDLRSEMRNLENRLIKWVIGATIALVAVFVALLTHNTARTDSALADLKADVRTMNTRMDNLDARIDRLDEKIDARFDALMAEIRALGRAAQ